MDGIAIWLLFLVFLPFLLFFWKMLLMAWKSILLTKKIKNLSDVIEARQNQLSTVSRSVDANIANSHNGPSSSSRRGSDETLKIDLPPTYEEVMRREATATTSTADIIAQTTTDTHEIVRIEVETISTHQRRDLP